MKNFLVFAFLSLLISSNAFALQCKTGNWGGEECITNVRVASDETTPVTQGTVLVYDFTQDTADEAAFEVVVGSAVTQSHYVAGIAQQTIATGDYGVVLVRGQGKIQLDAAAVSSGDDLYISATAGKARTDAGAGTRDKAIAFALEASAAGSETIDAFITVI